MGLIVSHTMTKNVVVRHKKRKILTVNLKKFLIVKKFLSTTSILEMIKIAC